MTKARALGVIRKGLVSCFGPGSPPGCPLEGAIQGPGADRNQESRQDCVSHTGMNLTLCCQIYSVLVCIYMW